MLDKEADNVFTDFYNSTRDLIADRFSSPLIFSFVISWLITNYKIVMTIFTQQTTDFTLDYKFWLISEYINIYNCAYIPFLLSLLYTFAYPYINNHIERFTLNRKMELREIKNAIEKTQTRTEDEVKAIYLKHFNVVQDYKEQIKNANETENELRVIISELQKQVIRLSSSTENLRVEDSNSNDENLKTNPKKAIPQNKLGNDEKKLIVVIGVLHNDGVEQVSRDELIKHTKLTQIDLDIAIEKLLKSNLIYRQGNGRYKLQHEGMLIFKELSN